MPVVYIRISRDIVADFVYVASSSVVQIKSILLLVTARPQEASSNSVLQSDAYLSDSVLAPLRGWSRTELLSLGTLDINTTCAIVCYRLGIKIMPSEVCFSTTRLFARCIFYTIHFFE